MKLEELAKQYGYKETIQLLEEATADSVSPGICMNEDCSYTTSVEPDCDSGYCEECKTQSVKSALIIAGII